MKYNAPIDASALKKHYSRTLDNDKVLLTAHSHRAWPDRILEGQLKAVDLAFDYVDQKWGKVFSEIIPKFQKSVAARIGCDRPDLIANGENCHELVTRVLSCFKWDNSTSIVTTNSEFHSMKRQLFRLEEEGVRVNYVSTTKKEGLTNRIVDAIQNDTNIVALSTVFFDDGYRLQNLGLIIEKARTAGATVILDAYHQFNVRRMYADKLGRDIFITSAGYKYADAGEGAAWLKIPENCSLRPVITGWYADFSALEGNAYPNPVNYGEGAQRFLGGTRDLSGICRQIEVFQFMDEQGMSVDVLELNNLHQTAYMIHLFDQLNTASKQTVLCSSREDAERGPFLSVDLGAASRARDTFQQLMDQHGIWTDTRGSVIRLGPAPYISQQELEYSMKKLDDVLAGLPLLEGAG